MTTLAGRIDTLLASQRVGVLATQQCNPPQPGQPYTSLMAFAHTPDLRFLVIATLKETQKHANLLQNDRLSLLVDNRGNSESDYQKAVAISAMGQAEAIPAGDDQRMRGLFLEKHPQLQAFIAMPQCALLRIRVSRYSVVSQFQATETMDLGAMDTA